MVLYDRRDQPPILDLGWIQMFKEVSDTAGEYVAVCGIGDSKDEIRERFFCICCKPFNQLASGRQVGGKLTLIYRLRFPFNVDIQLFGTNAKDHSGMQLK
jgi:hypothetical protein